MALHTPTMLLMIMVVSAVTGAAIAVIAYRRHPDLLLWLPVPLSLLGFSVLLHDQRVRFMMAGPLVSAQSLVLLAALWQRRRVTPGRGRYILATGLALVLSVMLLRVLGMFLGTVHIESVGDSHPVQSATFVISLVGLLLLAIGLVMMNQEHASRRCTTSAAPSSSAARSSSCWPVACPCARC